MMEQTDNLIKLSNGQVLSKETIDGDIATINFGPTHPATHGIFQNILTVDGEKILTSEQTVGYIHRAFEKLAERRPYNQITPITDRLNYCSSPINNLGWHMTVEKLLQVEVPKRVQYMRVIIMELARIADHLICDSIIGVDTGALTSFFYPFSEREKIYELYEEMCGARLTTNIGRIGGFDKDFTPVFHQKLLVKCPRQLGATARANMSVVPPGVKGTTMRTGLFGQPAVWALAKVAKPKLAHSNAPA